MPSLVATLSIRPCGSESTRFRSSGRSPRGEPRHRANTGTGRSGVARPDSRPPHRPSSAAMRARRRAEWPGSLRTAAMAAGPRLARRRTERGSSLPAARAQRPEHAIHQRLRSLCPNGSPPATPEYCTWTQSPQTTCPSSRWSKIVNALLVADLVEAGGHRCPAVQEAVARSALADRVLVVTEVGGLRRDGRDVNDRRTAMDPATLVLPSSIGTARYAIAAQRPAP